MQASSCLFCSGIRYQPFLWNRQCETTRSQTIIESPAEFPDRFVPDKAALIPGTLLLEPPPPNPSASPYRPTRPSIPIPLLRHKLTFRPILINTRRHMHTKPTHLPPTIPINFRNFHPAIPPNPHIVIVELRTFLLSIPQPLRFFQLVEIFGGFSTREPAEFSREWGSFGWGPFRTDAVAAVSDAESGVAAVFVLVLDDFAHGFGACWNFMFLFYGC